MSVLDFEMDLRTAIDAPRLSQEWLPDRITFETPELYPGLVKPLRDLGHTVVRTEPRPQGSAHSIRVIKPDSYVGVADWRRGGYAWGY